MRRSGSSPSSTVPARAWASLGFARIPLFPYTAPYEDITLKGG